MKNNVRSSMFHSKIFMILLALSLTGIMMEKSCNDFSDNDGEYGGPYDHSYPDCGHGSDCSSGHCDVGGCDHSHGH